MEISGTIYLLQCEKLLRSASPLKSFGDYLRWIRARIPSQVDVLLHSLGTKAQEQELHTGAKEWRHDLGGASGTEIARASSLLRCVLFR